MSQVTQPLPPFAPCAPTGLGTQLSDFPAREEHPDLGPHRPGPHTAGVMLWVGADAGLRAGEAAEVAAN